VEHAATETTPKRRGRFLALSVAVALAVAATGWLVFLRTTSGPLAAPRGTSSRIGVPIDVGGRLSVGIESPTYEGNGTLVIDLVVPDLVPDGLAVLGFARIPWGEGGVGSARSYPPDGYTLVPVKGSTVMHGEAVAIVVGVQPTSEGRFTIPGFTIHYHSGFRRYAAHYQQAVVVCVPEAGISGQCL